MSLTVGMIGIVAAFILLNYLVYKGLNVVLTATLVTLLIIVTSGLPILETWNIGMNSIGMILGLLGPVIMFGAVLGIFYTKSGAATSLANTLMKPFAKSKSEKVRILGCLGMFLIIRIIIGLAGIDNLAIMYTMLAICAGMVADINAPRKYINALLMIAGTCGTLVPGAPMSLLITIEEYIPGFDNSKTLLLRAIFLIVYVVVCVAILYRMIKKDKDNGLGYDPGPLSLPDVSSQKLPHVVLTVLPIIAVYVLYNFLHIDAWASLLIGIVVAMICFGAYIPKENGKGRFATIINTANSGVFLVPIGILFSMLPGFIMAQSPAYNALIEAMCSMPIPSAFGLLIIAILLVGIAGMSAVILLGGVTMSVFVPQGLTPQACGLIILFANTVLDTLPNNLGIITQCEIMDCSMKECYPSIFRTTVIATCALSIVVAIFGLIGVY
ncbi:MAG: hypothetical protein ACOX7P_05625 [Oscillospiraceae bacterium]|jgi:H+/gluconate symporter-like permease